MYLSKKHKLLFIAVPRTASNSVQKVIIDSGINHSSNIIHNLPTTPKDREAIALYHRKPSSLIDEGILSLEELREYTAFGFIREPFERWVSSIFLARYTGVLDSSEDALSQMCRLIRREEGPRPFTSSKRSEYRKDYKDPFSFKSYFFHNNEQVIDAYRFENVETITNNILTTKIGTGYKGTFPHINMNPQGVPNQFKQPIQEWLPADCYEKLSIYFSDDIAFYNSVDYINV